MLGFGKTSVQDPLEYPQTNILHHRVFQVPIQIIPINHLPIAFVAEGDLGPGLFIQSGEQLLHVYILQLVTVLLSDDCPIHEIVVKCRRHQYRGTEFKGYPSEDVNQVLGITYTVQLGGGNLPEFDVGYTLSDLACLGNQSV